MAIGGESGYIIGRMLGHKDSRSTEVYARLSLDPVRKAAEKVDKQWQSLLSLPQGKKIAKVSDKPDQTESDPGQPAIPPPPQESGLSPADTIRVQAKIFTALSHGPATKKDFFRKGGSQFPGLNAFTLQNILDDMVSRRLIELFQDEGAWDWNCWRHRLALQKSQCAG
jgi:hypothetical protein